MKYPEIITKDEAINLKYPMGEVLATEPEIAQRQFDAYRGMIIGNLYLSKVRIIFEDSMGPKSLDATISNISRIYVVIKQGPTIPLHRIRQIMFLT